MHYIGNQLDRESKIKQFIACNPWADRNTAIKHLFGAR